MDGALLSYETIFTGRVRYMFASFWNRNSALRTLQRGAKNYHTMLEVEKKVYIDHFS